MKGFGEEEGSNGGQLVFELKISYSNSFYQSRLSLKILTTLLNKAKTQKLILSLNGAELFSTLGYTQSLIPLFSSQTQLKAYNKN